MAVAPLCSVERGAHDECSSEGQNVHIDMVRPQKPKQMVARVVSVCRMTNETHGKKRHREK